MEPPEPERSDPETRKEQHDPVPPSGRESEDQHLAALRDEVDERIEGENRLVVAGQRRNRVEESGEEHQDRRHHRSDLADIPNEDPHRRQKPSQSHSEKDQWQEDEWEQEDGPGQNYLEEELGDKKNQQTGAGMKQTGAQGDPGENLQRKDHLFDVVDVRENQTGGAVDHLGKDVEDDHSGKENDGKFGLAFILVCSPSRFEDNREDERVDDQHQQRVDE